LRHFESLRNAEIGLFTNPSAFGKFDLEGNPMRLDPNPLFRRIMMPWYDSTPLCWLLLLIMVALALFSWAGIWVAGEDPAYEKAAWVPWTLLALTLFVGLSVLRRLISRLIEYSQRQEP
jgi:hypothetical protein